MGFDQIKQKILGGAFSGKAKNFHIHHNWKFINILRIFVRFFKILKFLKNLPKNNGSLNIRFFDNPKKFRVFVQIHFCLLIFSISKNVVQFSKIAKIPTKRGQNQQNG